MGRNIVCTEKNVFETTKYMVVLQSRKICFPFQIFLLFQQNFCLDTFKLYLSHKQLIPGFGSKKGLIVTPLLVGSTKYLFFHIQQKFVPAPSNFRLFQQNFYQIKRTSFVAMIKILLIKEKNREHRI